MTDHGNCDVCGEALDFRGLCPAAIDHPIQPSGYARVAPAMSVDSLWAKYTGVPCSFCGAQAGTRCVTTASDKRGRWRKQGRGLPAGQPASWPHHARMVTVRAAKENASGPLH